MHTKRKEIQVEQRISLEKYIKSQVYFWCLLGVSVRIFPYTKKGDNKETINATQRKKKITRKIIIIYYMLHELTVEMELQY